MGWWNDLWKNSGSFFTETLDPFKWVDNPNEVKLKNAQNTLTTASDQYTKTKPPTLQDINGDGRKDQLIDQNGNVIKDYSGMWDALDKATSQKLPSINDWMDQKGYSTYDPMAKDTNGQFTNDTMRQMQDLITQFQNGPSQMDQNQATAYAEQTLGLAPGTYASTLQGLSNAANTPIGDMQGMSPQELAARQKANKIENRNMEDTASKLIDNVRASTGSAARSYAAADSVINQISDREIQQQLAIYNDDFSRKKAESDKAMERYQFMVQAGQMDKAQYLKILQQSKAQAFQGYAVQVNTMLQQNQQYLQMYQADNNAVMANIDNIYKGINAEMGIDTNAMDYISKQYQMDIAPLLAQMNVASQQIETAKADASTFDLGKFLLGAAMTIGGVLLEPVSAGLSTGLITTGVGTIGSSF